LNAANRGSGPGTIRASSRPRADLALLRSPLLVLVCALIAGTAGATPVKTGKPAASQAPARVFATRDQLRECMAIEDGLKVRFKAIEVSNAAHEKMFDQVEAENTRLRELQAQIDHDSGTSVNAFNALVKDHNAHVKALNQEAADSRPAGDAYNDDMLAYNRQCAPLVYRVDDMEAVIKERKKAAAAPAASVNRP
jgi:hypothetical protein